MLWLLLFIWLLVLLFVLFVVNTEVLLVSINWFLSNSISLFFSSNNAKSCNFFFLQVLKCRFKLSLLLQFLVQNLQINSSETFSSKSEDFWGESEEFWGESEDFWGVESEDFWVRIEDFWGSFSKCSKPYKNLISSILISSSIGLHIFLRFKWFLKLQRWEAIYPQRLHL